MQTEKAMALNSRLKEGIDIFRTVYNQANSDLTPGQMKQLVDLFNDLNPEQYYEDFLPELKANIAEYKDIELIDDYLENYFPVVAQLDELGSSINRDIIRNNVEVKFLITARKVLEFNLQRLWNIVYACKGKYSKELIRIFTEAMREAEPGYELPPLGVGVLGDEMEDREMEARFDFMKLKAECNALTTKAEKSKLIKERLIDFRQWQLLYDNAESKIAGKAYYYSNKLYPTFVKLCNTELERLALYPDDASPVTLTDPEADPHPYKWKGSDTDLLELVAALYQHKNFVRRDGYALTRKELIAYFEMLFGLEIKDVEGKLTRATSRKINMTPFLDGLKVAFEKYAEDKDEKQRRRK